MSRRPERRPEYGVLLRSENVESPLFKMWRALISGMSRQVRCGG